jgi:hypothetical protein
MLNLQSVLLLFKLTSKSSLLSLSWKLERNPTFSLQMMISFLLGEPQYLVQSQNRWLLLEPAATGTAHFLGNFGLLVQLFGRSNS